MPRYYFDIDEGGQRLAATEALEFPTPEHARRSAVTALAEIAVDEFPRYESKALSVTIRDAWGKSIWQAAISLTSEWPNEEGDNSD